ncbi:MAG: YhjD/YihY/BrkB family envelope integrity protein [Burkholderiales bacterium]
MARDSRVAEGIAIWPFRRCVAERTHGWRYAIVGAGIAGVLWLAASTLFSVYVANFGSYNETYGSLGAIVGLMLWL